MASTGRWRLAARLARRELRRRPWRTVLVALLVAAPVAGVALVDTAYRTDRLPATSRDLGHATARLDLMGVDADRIEGGLADLVPSRFERAGWFTAPVPLRSVTAPDLLLDADVLTLDATATLAAGIVNVSSGRAPTADDEVLLDPDLARRFGVGIGDDLALVRPAQTFRVVGLGDAGTYGRTFLAPGFDVGSLRPSWLSMRVLIGRDGAAGQSVDDVSDWMSGVAPAAIAADGWGLDLRSDGEAGQPIVLFFGWLGATMLMGALGIVVGAAFAISGRRQLVTIGQLSATGADPSMLQRFLALQGTWTGAAGAALGLAGARGFVAATGDLLRRDGAIDVRALDWSVVGLTAIVVATVAALLPARSLAKVSTLTALGGRRPVPPVRPRQIRRGALVLAVGLVALTLSVTMAREVNHVGGTYTGPLLLAMASGGTVLAGVCLLGPVWVSMLARGGRRFTGAARLATRDLDRHRVRSGALLAAVMVVGAAAVGAGATVEQMHADDVADRADAAMFGPDVVWTIAYDTIDGVRVDLDAAFPTARAEIEAVVGPVRWVQQRTALVGRGTDQWEVWIADRDVLRWSGLPDDAIETVLAADVAVVRPEGQPLYVDVDGLRRGLGVLAADVVEVPVHEANPPQTLFVSAAVARTAGATVLTQWYGQADHDLTGPERDALSALWSQGSYDEAMAFEGVGTSESSVAWSVGSTSTSWDWSGLARWATLNVALVLVLVVVGLGLALEAAEGRDDRDTLVALGASPSTLAALVAWKAGLIAGVGGLLAVPLGYGTLWLCVAAARRQTTFPWIVAIGVAVVVPVVVAALAWFASRIAQQRRPVHALTSD